MGRAQARYGQARGYGPSIWAHILRDQLHVTAEEFWDCVQNHAMTKAEAIARLGEFYTTGR